MKTGLVVVVLLISMAVSEAGRVKNREEEISVSVKKRCIQEGYICRLYGHESDVSKCIIIYSIEEIIRIYNLISNYAHQGIAISQPHIGNST